jgi:hypothetical protein
MYSTFKVSFLSLSLSLSLSISHSIGILNSGPSPC